MVCIQSCHTILFHLKMVLSIDRFEFADITSIRIKYQEGFMIVPVAPGVTEIMGTPEQMWTQADKDLVIPSMF